MKTHRAVLNFAALLSVCNGASSNDLADVNNPAVLYERVLAQSITKVERESDAAKPFGDSAREAKAIVLNNSQWQDLALSICFWNGSDAQREAVIASAQRWNGIAKIKMNFREIDKHSLTCRPGDASHIRISLAADAKLKYVSGQNPAHNWSLIGRQATFIPLGGSRGQRYEVTMNLPEVPSLLGGGGGTDLNTLDFQVGHEFGHALGLLHEFQSKVCDGWIDVKLLAQDQGWNSVDAAVNLWPLSKLNIAYTEVGAYDINSIMQYNFPQKYYVEKPGMKNPCWRDRMVTVPSNQDLQTLVQIYGPGKSQSPAPFGAMISRYSGSARGTNSSLLRDSSSLRASLQSRFEFAKEKSPQAASALKNFQSVLDDLENFSQGVLPASANAPPQ